MVSIILKARKIVEFLRTQRRCKSMVSSMNKFRLMNSSRLRAILTLNVFRTKIRFIREIALEE